MFAGTGALTRWAGRTRIGACAVVLAATACVATSAHAVRLQGSDGFHFTGHQLPRADRGTVRTLSFQGHTLRYVLPRVTERAGIVAAGDQGPSCTVAAILRAGQGNYAQNFDEELVIVDDGTIGLTSLTNVQITNGQVAWQQFAPGTPGPIVVVAVKAFQGQLTTWSFDATDASGTTHCG